MTRVIDRDEVIATLREIVAAAGADTTRECTYTQRNDDGVLVPWCIAGCAFNRWGASVDSLYQVNVRPVVALVMNEWIWDDTFTLTDDATSVLSIAQSVQDCGETWGAALRAAENCAQEMS